MNKSHALTTAIDLVKTLLASSEINFIPNEKCANDLADFIETLAKRFEKIDIEN